MTPSFVELENEVAGQKRSNENDQGAKAKKQRKDRKKSV